MRSSDGDIDQFVAMSITVARIPISAFHSEEIMASAFA